MCAEVCRIPREGAFDLIGTYEYAVDVKGRLTMPPKFREELGETFTVTQGLDGCIFVYPQSVWKELEAKICALPMAKSKGLQRFFLSAAQELTLDRHGRILLPQELRRYAGLEREAVVIGVSGRAEIWSKEKWIAYKAQLEEAEICAAMEELGF